MRVTAETKLATRKKILDAARRLFASAGYEATTTRDIARAAGIASGTLFNYFPTKEAIVARLASDAMGDALALAKSDARHADAPNADAPNASAPDADALEEDLFALVAAGLRRMKPLRKHLPALLETSLSPLVTSPDEESASLRVRHLEAVVVLAARHGYGALSPTALQLYWTLYSGVLVFWANDNSPAQEDTLALIDDSVNMFVGWLRGQTRSDSTGRQR
jgi:AcrR family transcriptional regulator